MSIEKVRSFLAQYGGADRILEFPASSATVELAARALQIEPCRIAKTLAISDISMLDGPTKGTTSMPAR